MSRVTYHDEESTSGGLMLLATGAIAGVAAGIFLAQKFGGFSGLAARLRDRFGATEVLDEFDLEEDDLIEEYAAGDIVDDFDDDVDEDDRELEERVLEAYRHDPILGERAVDIGAIGDGVIELTGWVHSDDEADHAVTLARGIVDVTTVVNRLAVRDDESLYERNALRYASGDPAFTEAHWEGQGVGTGRRRQGSSAEIDRHEDPKGPLEDRWQNEAEALRAAAEETDGIAERRRRAKKAARVGRAGGAPIAPGGVPKADHVTDAVSDDPGSRAD